jgi:hypothetical protein
VPIDSCRFLDIGTGLPTANNTHEVAQRLAPESRIVYVDNDPLVLAHARALLTSSADGQTAYIDADLRDLDKILDAAGQVLDLAQPVAIMLIGVLHCIPAVDDPYGIVARLMAAVPSGTVTFRPRDQVAKFFDGLQVLEPGLVQYPRWRPAPGQAATRPVSAWCAVARKP